MYKNCRYEQCSWGWNDKNKYEEMTDESAWYLIAQSADNTCLGFSHFRFDLDEGQEVLYWYYYNNNFLKTKFTYLLILVMNFN